LRKVKAELFHESDHELEVVQRARGFPRIPATPDVQDETTVIGEHAVNLSRERQEPIDVVAFADVAVRLLEVEGVRRRSKDKIDRGVRQAFQQLA
jgi:hypothetical protein